jgi:hypothetical protein
MADGARSRGYPIEQGLSRQIELIRAEIDFDGRAADMK